MKKGLKLALQDCIEFYGIDIAKEKLDEFRKNKGEYELEGYVFFDKDHLNKKIESLTDINVNEIDEYYREFNIPKKRGGIRKITAPKKAVKIVQEFIYKDILQYYPGSYEYSHGYEKGKSIVTNAAKHCYKELVICMDIENFFTSIKSMDVSGVFWNLGYPDDIEEILTAWCTYKGCLAVGAPTSPALSNAVFEGIDYDISIIADKYGFTYTRYADDLTFSTNMKNIDYEIFINDIVDLLGKRGFMINDKKTKIYFKNGKQEVTGLIVNNGVKVKSKIKKEVRHHLYYCKKFGLKNHLKNIGDKYGQDIESEILFLSYLEGKINFIKMVEREEGEKLEEQYNEILMVRNEEKRRAKASIYEWNDDDIERMFE